MTKISKNAAVVCLAFLGVALLVIGELNPIWGSASQIMIHMGLAIAVTTIVTTYLNKSFEAQIKDEFSILKGAEAGSIKAIYSARTSEALDRMMHRAKQVEKEIDLLCIAGTDFLHTQSELVRILDRRRKKGSNIVIRILLLDPRCRYAVMRFMREEGLDVSAPDLHARFVQSKLCQDIILSIRELGNILHGASKGNVKMFDLTLKMYNYAPKALYLRVDDQAYIESYHDGFPREQGDMDSKVTKCLGKAVPIIEFDARSNLGEIYRSHFDYLWNVSQEINLNDSTFLTMNKSLEAREWAKLQLQRQMEEDQLLKLPGKELEPLSTDVAPLAEQKVCQH